MNTLARVCKQRPATLESSTCGAHREASYNQQLLTDIIQLLTFAPLRSIPIDSNTLFYGFPMAFKIIVTHTVHHQWQPDRTISYFIPVNFFGSSLFKNLWSLSPALMSIHHILDLLPLPFKNAYSTAFS